MGTLRIKITGGFLVAGIGAVAVTAVGTPARALDTPAGEAAQAAQAVEHCSFLGCLLHGRQEAPAPRREVVAQAPAADAAPDTKGEAKKDVPVDDAAVKKAAKPMPVVTLAADPADRSRLKALAGGRSHRRIRLVAPGAQDAEMTLRPVLDGASAGSLPLYSEQLHVLAGPAITTLADLRDKQVSFGPADGDTVAIARSAFAAAGIPVKETPLDVANALDGLATGDIAAVVLLAPQPSPLLGKLRAADLHLVDWPESAALPSGARLQLLKQKSYPRLEKGETHVVAVDAALALTPKGEHSAAARSLFASLKERTASLARRGFDRLGGAEAGLRQGRAVAKDGKH